MKKFEKLVAPEGYIYTDGKIFGEVINTPNTENWKLIPVTDEKYVKYLEIRKKSEERRAKTMTPEESK